MGGMYCSFSIILLYSSIGYMYTVAIPFTSNNNLHAALLDQGLIDSQRRSYYIVCISPWLYLMQLCKKTEAYQIKIFLMSNLMLRPATCGYQLTRTCF